MKIKSIIVTGMTLLLLAGCSTMHTSSSRPDGFAEKDNATDEENWRILTGKWYGHQQLEDGTQREWLVLRKTDGAYEITFKSTDKNGRINLTVEYGEWGVSGYIYFTIFKGWIKEYGVKPALPQDHWTRDAYEIIKLSEAEFIYSSTEDGDRYRVIKVPEDYEI